MEGSFQNSSSGCFGKAEDEISRIKKIAGDKNRKVIRRNVLYPVLMARLILR
jgi:hypothetical protein